MNKQAREVTKADLIPAEGIHHVSAPSSTNKDITLDISGSPFKYAVIAGATSADAAADLTAASRNGINAAIELGANAIIGVRFTTSMVMAGASEMLAYGTAVKI